MKIRDEILSHEQINLHVGIGFEESNWRHACTKVPT